MWDPFTVALLGIGAAADAYDSWKQGNTAKEMTAEQLAHDDKWRARGDVWRGSAWDAQERNLGISHGLMRAEREDMRPWREVGAGAVKTLAAAYGVPRVTSGGDALIPEFVPVDAPETLDELEAGGRLPGYSRVRRPEDKTGRRAILR